MLKKDLTEFIHMLHTVETKCKRGYPEGQRADFSEDRKPKEHI